MFKIEYNLTCFSKSINNICDLPTYKGVEVAFVGRSNTGKSSLLNVITNQNHLAKTSKSPGNTKFINFFKVKKNFYLVDFPGYGYSKFSKSKNWQLILLHYLKIRKSLKGLVLLVDIRRSIQKIDQLIINNALNYKIPMLLLLTKSDKISKHKRKVILDNNRKKFILLKNEIHFEIFSSTLLIGIKKLKNVIDYWYQL